jgi:VanZ family protein
MSDFKYPGVWWALGCGLLIFIVYVSVADLSLPQVDASFGDKVNHLLAYGLLTGWFGQLIKSSRHRLLAAFGFVALGMLMEVIQSTLPHRWFDMKDALANTLGVIIALVVLHFGGNTILQRFEKALSRSTGK